MRGVALHAFEFGLCVLVCCVNVTCNTTDATTGATALLRCVNEEQTSCDVRRKDFGAELHHAGDNEGNPLGHQDSGEPDHNAAEDHRAQGSLPPR